MTIGCETQVFPSQHSLTSWQTQALQWIANLGGGRDVVIAIDLTESVRLNDEGRARLRQIIQDSLNKGDSVYVVPFASNINPLAPDVNPLTPANGIKFEGKEDIEKILQAIPWQPNLNLRQTDIQLAELAVYQGLAQLNQCRLSEDKPIKSQSVVWITDAPLNTNSVKEWRETPVDSPFRQENSEAIQQRQAWLQTLPTKERSQKIISQNNQEYKISVIDIAPTVQELCTVAPGGKQTCLVNPYLLQQLWIPTSILSITLLAGLGGIIFAGYKLFLLQKTWNIKVSFDSEDREDKKYQLKHNQRLVIGSEGINSIDCPGDEIRGYLARKGDHLFLIPTKTEPIYYREREITQKEKLSGNGITLNCPQNHRDFEIKIIVNK